MAVRPPFYSSNANKVALCPLSPVSCKPVVKQLLVMHNKTVRKITLQSIELNFTAHFALEFKILKTGCCERGRKGGGGVSPLDNSKSGI